MPKRRHWWDRLGHVLRAVGMRHVGTCGVVGTNIGWDCHKEVGNMGGGVIALGVLEDEPVLRRATRH